MSQGGSIVAFEIKGGIDAGRNFLIALEMLSLSSNLGVSIPIVTHQSSTTIISLSNSDRSE